MPRSIPAAALARVIVCALALLLVAPPPAFAADSASSELGRFVFQHVSPRTYAAEASNWTGVQDATGRIFIGNGGAVITFDGATWRRVVPKRFSDGFRSVALARDGKVYAGGAGEFGWLRALPDGGHEFVSLVDELPAADRAFREVFQIEPHGDAVYFVSYRKIFIWRGGKFTVIPAPGCRLYSVGETLYLHALNAPLQRVANDRIEVVSDEPNFRAHDTPFMLGEPDGGLLIATGSAGFWRMKDGRVAPWPTAIDPLLKTKQIYNGWRLPDGSIAVTFRPHTGGGMAFLRADGSLAGLLDESSGLPNQVIQGVVPDRDSGLWLCTGNGLAHVDWPGGFTLFDRFNGLGTGTVTHLRRHEGVLYAATTRGLFRLGGAELPARAARFEKVLDGEFWFLHSDADGLLAMSNAEIFRLVRGEFKAEFRLQPPAYTIERSRRDPAIFWLGQTNGLRQLRRVGERWADGGLVQDITVAVRTVKEDATGALWGATVGQGFFRVTPGAAEPDGKPAWKTEWFRGGRGLPAEIGSCAVVRWGDEIVFALTGSPTLFRRDPATDTFVRLGEVPELPKGHTYSTVALSAENSAHLWFSRDVRALSDRRLYRVARTGRIDILPQRLFEAIGAATRLFEESTEAGAVLWAAGNDGLLRIEPARALAPPRDFGVELITPDVLPGEHRTAERNNLEFRFVAPRYTIGAPLDYRTRLVGFEERWSAWSPDRKRTFTNLPPAAYRFEVQARDSDGHLSTIATRTFTVLPPWWRTWWFIGIASIGGVGGVAGVTRWFANRALKRRVELLEAQSAVERERLRLARDLHDEVGSGLGRVILFAGEADRNKSDPDKLAGSLARVRNAAQELVQHAREIVWAVSPQHDTLASVIERLGDYAEETLRSAGIACAVQRPPPEKIPPLTLGSEARHSLFLAVKEAVHNCVKYSEAKTAEFHLEISGNNFVITLRDHGRGFAPGEQRGSGHGTLNIVARAEALGGRAEITSELGRGTTVMLRVPLLKGGAA